jgi:EAL domain-containing protein (putative c-di-GMP-specific phosphodiesterase class I)
MGRYKSCAGTAEGVENADQLRLLRALGCDHAQGFLLSKPLEPDQLAPWCDAFKQRWSELTAEPRSVARKVEAHALRQR